MSKLLDYTGLQHYHEKVGLGVGEMMSGEVTVPGAGLRPYPALATGKYGTNATYFNAAIPVTAGERYIITAVGSSGSRYGFLASLAAPVSGGDIDLVSGTAMTGMTTGEKVIVTIPSGCVALIFHMGNDSGSYVFQPKLEKVGNLANLKDTLFIEQSLSGYTPIKYLILASGNWGENATYKHIIIPVKVGEIYKIVANNTNNCIYAFLTSDSCAANTAAPLVANTSRATIPAGDSSIFTIPDTCTYLYVYYGDSTGTFLPESLSIWLTPIVQELYNQGIESPTSRILTIPMESGNLGASTGRLYFSSSGEENNLARLRSPLYLNISSSDTISSIQLDEGESYNIFCYNSNFDFLGYVSGTTLLPGTSWVKFVLAGTTNFSHTKSLTITVWKYGEVRFAKNAYTPETLLRYNFEVKRPFLPQSNSESSYAANGERIWDNGWLYLPYNYSRDGKPCPLIIWNHGTGGQGFFDAPAYASYLQFLSKNGYAIADCSGITSYYGSQIYGEYVQDLRDSKSNPLLYSCISSMYEWICKNFNVEREVHLLSKSAGGLTSMYLAYNGPFKVKSMALLAPALLMAGQSFRVTGKVPLDFWLGQLGYDSPDITYPLSSEDRSFVLANYTNLLGYDAFFSGTDIDYQATLARMYNIEESATGSTTSTRLANAYAADSQLMAIFDAAKKNLPTPTKIWIAPDDDSVPYMWAQKLVAMAQRGGYHCFLRTMPRGTGGHHSVDNGASALHTNYTCDNGEVVDIPVAFAEACDWFKQW